MTTLQLARFLRHASLVGHYCFDTLALITATQPPLPTVRIKFSNYPITRSRRLQRLTYGRHLPDRAISFARSGDY
jgi:hypothetical protein